MQRLSGLDAAFLAAETPSMHMHVMGIVVVDPSTAPDGFSFETLRDFLATRLDLIPPFRRRLVPVPFDLDAPVWVEDPDFDIDFHMRRAAVPSPGGARELAEFAADIASRPLDRAKPLWEMHVIEGLEHGYAAVVSKIHHSAIDGMAGVGILGAMFDLDPESDGVRDYTPEWQPDRIPSDAELIAGIAVSMLRQPVRFVRAISNLANGVTRAVRRIRDESLHVTMPLTAPRLSMNRSITPHRKVAFASVSLDDIKAVKNALDVKVNDVVLAVTAGALRTYLDNRGELPDRPLVATVPTSVRSDDNKDDMGNRVSALFTSLPVEIADPVERVLEVRRSSVSAKHFHEEVGGATLQEWTEIAAPAFFQRAVRLYSNLHLADHHRPIHNLVVSNVPGPPFPLYIAGARLVSIHPMGPVFDGAGLNVTVISYLDHVDFGFLACSELVPDVDDLAAAVPEALAELVKAAADQSEARSPE